MQSESSATYSKNSITVEFLQRYGQLWRSKAQVNAMVGKMFSLSKVIGKWPNVESKWYGPTSKYLDLAKYISNRIRFVCHSVTQMEFHLVTSVRIS